MRSFRVVRFRETVVTVCDTRGPEVPLLGVYLRSWVDRKIWDFEEVDKDKLARPAKVPNCSCVKRRFLVKMRKMAQ